MKFKCKLTGNVVEFTSHVDIVTTQAHPDYEEYVEVVEEAPKKVVAKKYSKG